MKRFFILIMALGLLAGGCNNDKGGASSRVCFQPNDTTCYPNCGNGVCDSDEDELTCPLDCGTTSCGDGVCQASEDHESCPQDCTIETCGDGVCQFEEDIDTCPADCILEPTCGNGVCEAGENQLSCPEDCSGTCGDGVCQSDETASSCPNDCGDCLSGSTRLCGVSNLGICRYGQQTCTDGTWGTCEGAVGPDTTEVCDGQDNDCDGLVDNGPNCPCVIGAMRPCGSSVGACSQGIQYCEDDGSGNAIWSATCTGGTSSAPEVCDGLDNDCNGVVDDGIGCQCSPGSTRVCGSSVGQCVPGVQTCTTAGVWDGTCTGEVPATGEVCDGQDNDCNGVVDDGIGCQCDPGSTRVCGSAVGECAPGIQTCLIDGTWDSNCVGSVGPSGETCDGLDNDCNGVPDDSIGCQCTPGENRVCGNNVGECSYGMQTCLPSGIWESVCTGAVGPTPELCDGLDNDCNGTPDDGVGCQCNPGEDRPCGSNVGACSYGTQPCEANGTWGACSGQVLPSAELCDNIDNDCNGLVDDGVGCQCLDGSTRVCGSVVGQCQTGVQTCASGTWGTCVGEVVASAETCDNLDNDCNGLIDDGIGCQCAPGSTRTCGSSIGECRPGTQTCGVNGVWDGLCNGEVAAAVEVCDGKDNDCNGFVDDGISCQCNPGSTRVCGSAVGTCVPGTQTCLVDGTWDPNCVGETGPGTETCDGLDNDCNGVADDAIPCQCTPGENRVCGSNIGMCSYGTQTCNVNGIWDSVCNGEVGPSTETCDGLDNDCNGTPDDGIGCQCNPGDIRPCGSNVGMCSYGTQTCDVSGVWGVCGGQVLPSAELCDGLDNDCNGLVDDAAGCQCTDGSTRVCGTAVGECVPGVQTCSGGVWGSCAGETVAVSEVCDGLDNDCNGIPDEGINCQCDPGDTRSCGSAVGECQQGTQSCVSDGMGGYIWDSNCVGAVGPSTEVCDGLDNDCNGTPDDAILCQCIPGSTRTCGSNTGVCEAGEQTCQPDYTWGPCSGAVWPTTEVCDNLDNDCDGAVDNNIVCACQPGGVRTCGSAMGECETGTQTCQNDHSWGACTGATGPGTEICDGLDNDCNGVVDDGLNCICIEGSVRPCGSNVGTCSQGTQTCMFDAGSGETYWSATCSGDTGPVGEVCDGLDNDCNGAVDDGLTCQCAVGSTRLCGSAIGQCVPGSQTCVLVGSNTQWGACSGATGPSAETCNGLDDDCNGVPDDSGLCQCTPGSTRTCGSNVGQCSFGIQTCDVNGVWEPVCTGAIGPGPELCDGVDNDCNGTIDDGVSCQCNAGDERVCGVATGECQQGIQVCLPSGVWNTACTGSVGPSTETCDGLDNDCNGVADDAIGCQCIPGSSRVCGTNEGQCQQGVQVCDSDGLGWGACNGSVGAALEICDGLDNDCNGLIDEGINCQCQPGDSRLCGSNVGECMMGNQDCVSDGLGGFVWSGVCVGEIGPSSEVCDNQDNDCNGVADDAIGCQCTPGESRVCGSNVGQCSQGVQTCDVNALWGSVCVGSTGPSTEVCDGYDNDCNGVIDDGLNCFCTLGSLKPCGSSVGECSQGTQQCLYDAGTGETYWSSTCVGSAGPSAETCNGLDDDCNGVADEGCQCIPGSTRVCGSAIGQCSFGVQTCLGSGVWGTTCAGEVLPSAEACDGVDNDCNGIIDEGCQCLNGSTRPCGSSVGECVQGVQTCSGGVWGLCTGSTGPSTDGPPTSCDGLDNDCNGIVDDACGCTDGDTSPCGTDEGACVAGTTTCSNGVWGACIGYTGPVAEVCGDLIDQNCNGIADDPGVCPP